MFTAEIGCQRLFEVHVLGEHPVQLSRHGLGRRTNTVAQQPHVLLLSSFRIHVHVDGAMDALVDDDHRQFTVYTANQTPPELLVFGCVVLGVVDGEVAQTGAVNDDPLNAGVDNCLDMFGMQPWTCNKLSESLPGFKQGWA